MKNYSLIIAIYLGVAGLMALAQTTPPVPVLHIKADQIIAPVSPVFSGMMTEEINHAYDGGLYAELIQNRVFKDDATYPAHWSLVQEAGAVASIALDHTNTLNEQLATSLRLDVGLAAETNRAGIANDGYWGIPVKPGTSYRASFYAKAAAGFTGPVLVAIESEDGMTVFAQAKVKQLTENWQKYSVTLTTPGNVTPTTKARFILAINSPGTVWFNLVSLFPPTWHNRPNGNRIDLMQKLDDIKPGFLRFPGGNYLEGSSIATRFPWKETLGDLTNRPGHSGC